jgi:hypothetical protein
MKNQRGIEFFVAVIVTIIFFYFMLKKINEYVNTNLIHSSKLTEKQMEQIIIKLDSLNQKVDFMIQKQYEIQDSMIQNHRP